MKVINTYIVKQNMRIYECEKDLWYIEIMPAKNSGIIASGVRPIQYDEAAYLITQTLNK